MHTYIHTYIHITGSMVVSSACLPADAAASRQEFAEQLAQLTQQSDSALSSRPEAEQYNQVGTMSCLTTESPS